MASIIDLFSSMHSNSGLVAQMVDDSKIQTKGVGEIDLDYRYFNDVLYVTDLAANLFSVYEMTHTREEKRLTFTPDLVEIAEISSNKVVA